MELFWFSLFIWFIGWIFSCGAHSEAVDVTKQKKNILDYFSLFFFWPHYLGYTYSSRKS